LLYFGGKNARGREWSCRFFGDLRRREERPERADEAKAKIKKRGIFKLGAGQRREDPALVAVLKEPERDGFRQKEKKAVE